MSLSSPALTISEVTYHSERQHSTLDLKPSQAPSIKPPHMGWKRLSKELSLGFNENQMLWAQLSCFLSRTTEQPLLQFHQEPCPSFPSSSALLSVPNQNQIKSSQPKCLGVLPKYCYLCWHTVCGSPDQGPAVTLTVLGTRSSSCLSYSRVASFTPFIK